MDVLRRNTDYALRAAVYLAKQTDGPVSTRMLAKEQGIPYQLACKLLQRLQKAGIVKSTMGPQGGFELSRDARQIPIGEVVSAIQGPVRLNRCLLGMPSCPREGHCEIRRKLVDLQSKIETFLAETSLADLVEGKD